MTTDVLTVGWRVRDVPLASLHPWAGNPRRILRPRWDALLHSLREDPDFMHARPLVVTPTGTVMAGNMRLLAMRELGWATAPCVVIEDAGAAARAIRDNVGYGEWVEDELAEALWAIGQEMDLAIPDVALATGLDPADVDRMIGQTPAPAADAHAGEPAWSERVCPSCGHRWRDL